MGRLSHIRTAPDLTAQRSGMAAKTVLSPVWRQLSNGWRPGSHRSVSGMGLTAPADRKPQRRVLYIECSNTYLSDVNTGIQRVVRNVLRHAPVIADRYGFDVVPLILHDGRLIVADASVVLSDKQRQRRQPRIDTPAVNHGPPPPAVRHALLRLGRPLWRGLIGTLATLLPAKSIVDFLYAPPAQFGLAACVLFPSRAVRHLCGKDRPVLDPVSRELDLRPVFPGDALLLLDSSWHLPMWPPVQKFKARGGTIVGVVYDLIPVSHPDFCVPELVSCFHQWLRNLACRSHLLVAISQATATELAARLPRYSRRDRLPPVAHFHLGSELDFVLPSDDVRQTIRDNLGGDDHVYIMVGSIEPRKNHSFVLQAFERLWSTGCKDRLVIIGRDGWRNKALLDRMQNHPEHGRKLHLVRDALDSELDHAYRNASALIIASEVEGFGLPVVEAFQRGLPVICSDIPAFREIASGRATFFRLDDPDLLAAVIRAFDRTHDPARRTERAQGEWLTWRESTEQLFAAVAPYLGWRMEGCGQEKLVGEPSEAD